MPWSAWWTPAFGWTFSSIFEQLILIIPQIWCGMDLRLPHITFGKPARSIFILFYYGDCKPRRTCTSRGTYHQDYKIRKSEWKTPTDKTENRKTTHPTENSGVWWRQKDVKSTIKVRTSHRSGPREQWLKGRKGGNPQRKRGQQRLRVFLFVFTTQILCIL